MYNEIQFTDNLVQCVHEIALICKDAKYPEDLEDIYDVLENYGVDYKEAQEEQ